MDEMKHRRLQELDRSDFEITKGEPDIRGWDVRNDAGLKIGEVEELIVDAQQKKIRYMVVDLDHRDLKLPDRKVLVPIGLAELHKEDDDVLLPAVTVDQLSILPDYDGDNLTDETEQQVCTAFGRSQSVARNIVGATTSEEATDNDTFRPERHVNERKEEANTTRLKEEASDTVKASKTEIPAIGSAEYYGNFYQHAFFNDYNLYKNRQQDRSLTQETKGSDYERGLRLWELRHEGDTLTDDASATGRRNRDLSDESRKELIQNRRRDYEERRSKKKSSIIQRINDEGLQEA